MMVTAQLVPIRMVLLDIWSVRHYLLGLGMWIENIPYMRWLNNKWLGANLGLCLNKQMSISIYMYVLGKKYSKSPTYLRLELHSSKQPHNNFYGRR